MKKELNIEMGARIKDKRRSLKYTREMLAEMIEISPQFLANIESGKKGMSFETLKKLCQSLGVSSDYIIFGRTGAEHGGRVHELIENTDEKYIPFIEAMLANVLRIIAAAQRESDE